MYRPIVALVPPVPAPTTIHSGTGWVSSPIWSKIDSAMLLLPAPVGGTLGVGELIEVMPAGIRRQPLRLLVHLCRLIDEMATAALGFDQRDLRRARRRRHHRDERQFEHRREIRLRDRRRTRRCLDDRGVLVDPPVAQRVEEQRPRQPMLEAAGDVGGLVLEVEREVDVFGPTRRQRVAQQMRVGAAPGVGCDQPHRVVHPRT